MRKRMISKETTNSFAGKWALITGASSGLGLEFADLLAAPKVNLVLAGPPPGVDGKAALRSPPQIRGGCAGRGDRSCLAGRGQPPEKQSRREVGGDRHLTEQCRIRLSRRFFGNADREHR